MNKEIQALNKKAKAYSDRINKAIEETKKVVVGQTETIEALYTALIANGHVLLEGAPGLAKTLMVKTLAETVNTSFKRLQFTPDLLPADIIGTKIFEKNRFITQKGPIFHNIILADEINRAPPKVQSALLEAMQERQVTIHGDSFKLDPPFLVLATMNPLEHEGVYTLPEAQVDRFMLKVIVDYPEKDEEKEIIRKNTTNKIESVKHSLSPKDIIEMQRFCREVYVDEKIEDYVVEIISATRNPNESIEYGASPRACIWMIMAAKATAILDSRGYVLPEDIKKVAKQILRHRIILTYSAEAEGITTDQIIDEIIKAIKVP